MLKKVISCIPKPVRRVLERSAKKLVCFGFKHYCPLCRSWIRFFKPFCPTGTYSRPNAECPVCGALERHRHLWLLLLGKTDFFDAKFKKMLHIAPEVELSIKFKQVGGIDYLSGDLASDRAMVKIDVTDIKLPDESFDVIYCSHVLEHVREDRKAISEFYRILKAGGYALIEVPITAEKTLESTVGMDPAEHIRIFGREDHVRLCGPDYKSRLEEAGFDVNRSYPTDIISERQIERFGLITQPIFFCKKPASTI